MSNGIELRHLRYFLAVAESLHFTKAAAELGIAQPPLSQQIKHLETLVGHRLLERTTRGVKLTPAGELMAEQARGTLRKVEDDLNQVRRIGRGEEGTLTAGFSGSVMFTEFPLAIEEYRRTYPDVELRLRELATAVQVSELLHGTLDLGLLRDGDPTPGLTLTPIARESFVAVLPQGHALARKRAFRLADLADEPFVLFDRAFGPLAFDRTIACCEREGFLPRIIQRAHQWPTVVRLVAVGLGVSLAPACIAKAGLPGVVYRKLPARVATTIDLAVRTGAANRLALNFAGMVRRRLGS